MTNTITSLAAHEQINDRTRAAERSRRCAEVRGQGRIKFALSRRMARRAPRADLPASLDRPRLEA
jgi:hypothetical protein